jgi:N-acetylmuramic acid 6-phosphate etherase
MPHSELFKKLQSLTTERRNPRTTNIDTASIGQILRLINDEDRTVPEAVSRELSYVESAVELIVETFKSGGRLIYIGAGTSGRLGVVDASECPPTFGTPPDMVRALIAGGPVAVFTAQEGSEDHAEWGERDLAEIELNASDIVCGIAASRRTPYVVGGIEYARSIGCKTLFVTCNPRDQFDIDVDVAICVNVGPEPIMGSTRMKSGTAQKLVLNMLTTASMIQLGKVYENMMIDLQMNSQKLVERSKRITMIVTGLDYDEAAALLKEADGHVKTALLMHLAGVSRDEAISRLDRADGFVRKAIEL